MFPVKAALPLSIAFQTPGSDGLSLFRLFQRRPRTLVDYPHSRQDPTPPRALARGVPSGPSGWASSSTRYQDCVSRRHRGTVSNPRWRSDGDLAVELRNCRRTRHRPACMSETETAARLSGLAGYSMMWFAPQQCRMAVLRMVGVVARSARWHCKCLGRRIAVLVV